MSSVQTQWEYESDAFLELAIYVDRSSSRVGHLQGYLSEGRRVLNLNNIIVYEHRKGYGTIGVQEFIRKYPSAEQIVVHSIISPISFAFFRRLMEPHGTCSVVIPSKPETRLPLDEVVDAMWTEGCQCINLVCDRLSQ